MKHSHASLTVRRSSCARGRGLGTRSGKGLGGLVVALAILGAVAFFGLRRATEQPAPEPTLDERYQADDRIAVLLHPCTYGRPFQVDTSAMVEVLVSKLDEGVQLEPMRRAKQELARIGAPAALPLRRLYDEASRDMWRVPIVLNVLDVCALSEDPFGLDIGRDALSVAREEVRARASYIFAKHGTPEDYQRVRAAFIGCTNPDNALKYAQAMKTCDRGLFHFEVGDIIAGLVTDEGGPSTAPLADSLAIEAADAVDPVVVDKLYQFSSGLAPRLRAYLIAPSAAQPDATNHAAALDELRANLSDPLVGPRQNTAQALALAGLARELFPMLELDSDPRLRALAATLMSNAVREGTLAPELVIAPLQRGLGDAEGNVRAECLAALLRLGDPVGWTEALRRLEGSIEERDVAVRTLRDAWQFLPAEAPDQARARLVQLYERRAGEGAPGSELTSVLSALGAVPGRATATFLLETAARLGDTPLRGITGHRWCLGQVYNAGPEARAVLRERLAVETDPIRRLDLISFIWQDTDPDAVEVLLGVVTDAARDRHERLYAAERLLHMGASNRVAPVLKAIYWESTDPVLRPGLQCLLWAWYGVST
jgi:hypothetical protein